MPVGIRGLACDDGVSVRSGERENQSRTEECVFHLIHLVGTSLSPRFEYGWVQRRAQVMVFHDTSSGILTHPGHDDSLPLRPPSLFLSNSSLSDRVPRERRPCGRSDSSTDRNKRSRIGISSWIDPIDLWSSLPACDIPRCNRSISSRTWWDRAGDVLVGDKWAGLAGRHGRVAAALLLGVYLQPLRRYRSLCRG